MWWLGLLSVAQKYSNCMCENYQGNSCKFQITTLYPWSPRNPPCHKSRALNGNETDGDPFWVITTLFQFPSSVFFLLKVLPFKSTLSYYTGSFLSWGSISCIIYCFQKPAASLEINSSSSVQEYTGLVGLHLRKKTEITFTNFLVLSSVINRWVHVGTTKSELLMQGVQKSKIKHQYVCIYSENVPMTQHLSSVRPLHLQLSASTMSPQICNTLLWPWELHRAGLVHQQTRRKRAATPWQIHNLEASNVPQQPCL